jgi:hypothetical protein
MKIEIIDIEDIEEELEKVNKDLVLVNKCYL